MRIAESALALVGLSAIVYCTCFDLSPVGPLTTPASLEDSFADGRDLLLTERVTYRFRQPRRWELVVYADDAGRRVIQRVVGLPGERVSMNEQGILLIDGVEQPTPAGVAPEGFLRYGNLLRREPIACKNAFYLLGDAKREMDDSRFNGPLKAERVIGRPWLIVAPWNRADFANQ